ncbi:MAG: hypothetical protein H5U10_04410 [Desulfacinum sp.]|nr:hypothetical protein [Desulfacinum sp.]MBZ4658864.1 hypothetical protein [Desulfacinum sp.]
MFGIARCLVWVPVLVVAACGGCASVSTTSRSGSVELAPPRVIAWQCPAPHRHRRAAVAAFEVPKGMERAALEMARIYSAILAAEGTFGQVMVLAEGGGPAGSSVPDGVDLLVRGKVERFVAGSGALSEHVDVQVWVKDMRTGSVLWWMEQSALSKPRRDLDLFWNVIPGGGAASYQRLTQALARQFAELLSEREAKRRGCLNLDR